MANRNAIKCDRRRIYKCLILDTFLEGEIPIEMCDVIY